MPNVEQSKPSILAPKKLSEAAAILCLMLFLAAYITNSMDRLIFPMLLTWIGKSYGYSLKQAGLLSVIFTLGIGVAAIPAGYLLDRWNRKAVLLTGMVIYSIFTLATIFAAGFYDMLFYRAMTGVGEALQIAALFAAASSYFYKHKAMVIGTINLGFGIGGAMGPYFGTKMTLATNNWHTPFVVYTLLGLIMAGVIWIFVPKIFTESRGPVDLNPADQPAVLHIPENFWNRNVKLCTLVAVLLGLIQYGFIGLYTTFLIKHLHFAPLTAGLALSLYGIGCMFGLPCGWISDRLTTRYVAIAAYCGLAINAFLIFDVATSPQFIFVLSATEGLFASSFLHPCGLSLVQRSVRPEMIGRATGFFTSMMFLGGAGSGLLFAWLADRISWNAAGLIQISLFSAITVITLLCMNEKELFLAGSASTIGGVGKVDRVKEVTA